jgi:hypothetical protein
VIIPARFGLIWCSGFRGEDLNVIFYQNMPNLHNNVMNFAVSLLLFLVHGQLSRLYDILVSLSFYITFTIIELLDHMSFDFFHFRWWNKGNASFGGQCVSFEKQGVG